MRRQSFNSLNVSSCWQSKEEREVLLHIGKGPRLIILIMQDAWICQSITGGYHSDMNFENFNK